MKTEIRLNATEHQITRLFDLHECELDVPSHLNKKMVEETLEDATILAHFENENNTYCVLAAWIDKEEPFNTMFYFTRFFNIFDETVCSHDATANNIFDMMLKLSETSNRYFAR